MPYERTIRRQTPSHGTCDRSWRYEALESGVEALEDGLERCHKELAACTKG